MSDAPAAPVTENGVPPAAQESVVEETPGFKVFAGNLAYTTTDEGLKAFFAPVQSEVLSAQVIMRSGNRSAGYGFVSLATLEAAQKAVELLNNTVLDERNVIVELAKPADQKDKEKKQRRVKRRTGRRGSKSVPGEVSEAEANGEASADATKAEGATPANGDAAKPKKKKKARKPKRKAGATSEGEAPASGAEGAASGAEGTTEGGAKKPRQRKPRAPRPPRPAGEDPQGEPSKSVLFVANLGFNIDDEGLAKLFTDAGIKVNSARIVRRRWGKPRKSKGYGFVDVGNEEEQKKAIEALQGKEVGGRAIAVKIAVNTPNDGDASDGGAPNDAAPKEEEKEKAPEAAPEVAPVAA
ncbi:RNA-binding domain-containing protein [Trametes cingulata]|nr:RNA-binding domain-containing protein [Trametes cingulata]